MGLLVYSLPTFWFVLMFRLRFLLFTLPALWLLAFCKHRNRLRYCRGINTFLRLCFWLAKILFISVSRYKYFDGFKPIASYRMNLQNKLEI